MAVMAVLCWVLIGLGQGFTYAEALRIRVNTADSFQTIDGFGASDAWRCQFVGRDWPIAKREHIADLLFSRDTDTNGNPKGIGLSLWRFNIGAGTAEQGDASGIRNPWRRAECFLNADGSYDWSKQAGQQWFLKAARRRGVEKFLAFVNSPPVQFTRNGRGYAAKGDTHLNLQPGKLGLYAEFLVQVMEHFEKSGLPFNYLSPFNEPQWNWDQANQEGTPARNADLYPLVRELSRQLAERKLSTQLVIGEAGTIGHVAKVMDDDGRDNQARFFFDPASPTYVGALPNVAPIISAHSYFSVWPLSQQVEYRQMLHLALRAANPKLGYWMSEYCILQRNREIRGGGGRDLGMDTALYVARIIHHDLTLAEARSWQWWTALTQCDFKDGLLYLDDGTRGNTGRMGAETSSLMRDGVVRESKLLWVLGNYARFVRPGMTRVACAIEPESCYVDGVLASAYKGPDNKLVLVLTNLSREEQHCDLGLAGQFDVFTTSEKANLARTERNGSDIALAARAVVTCVNRQPR